MRTRPLGNSDLQITPIGFGSWAAGGPWQFGWGSQDDAASIAAIHRALDLGLNWIDTAAVYGLGHSEEVVGKVIASRTGEPPLVFTKCGMIWDAAGKIDYSLRRESVRRECEESLRRLGVGSIDLYQMHWPADELEETLEGWSAMAELQREGKVRWIGVSNCSTKELVALSTLAPITALQPPYSLIKRQAEGDQLPWCGEHNVGTLVYSPMGSGLLTGGMTKDRIARLPEGDWRKGNPEFQDPKLSQNLALAERLRLVGEKLGRSPGEVALAWVLRTPLVTGAIVGARNAAQVDGISQAAEIKLTLKEIAEIEG
jgi:aryl-alcohol dehydrogenase-like predicted oxidoreductase